MKVNIKNTVLGGVAMVTPLLLLSPVFNVLLFGKWVDTVEFSRHFGDWLFFPGMLLITLVFGMCLSISYQILYVAVPGNGIKNGFNYGLLVWLMFSPFAEVFNYCLYQLPLMVVVSGLIHNLISLPLGGLLMGKVCGGRKIQQSTR